MKRNTICLFSFLLVLPALMFAQDVKFGHVDMEKIYASMPGIDTVESNYKAFYAELEEEATALSKEFEKAYTEYEQKRDTYSAAVAKVKEQELQKMMAKIQTFQEEAEQRVAQRKEELIMPFQEKILEAVNAVAKEGNYTYIFNAALLSFGADSEDIAPKVKQKLGIQ